MASAQTFVRKRATVQPGGQVIVVDPNLLDGASVEVLILMSAEQDEPRKSVLDVLKAAPGHVVFNSAEEVQRYLREERDSWDD